MSTNIHNGRVMRGTIDTAYHALMLMKPSIAAAVRDLEVSWATRNAVKAIDAGRMEGHGSDRPLASAWQTMRDRMDRIGTTGIRDPEVDFGMEIYLFPIGRGHGGRRTLMIVNTEQRRLMDILDAHPRIHDHAYWDSTDPDETVSGADWERRRQDWDRALPGAGVPADRCLTMRMHPVIRQWMPRAEEVMKHVDPIETRAERIAGRMHVDELFKQMNEITGKTPETAGEIMHRYHDAIGMREADPERTAVLKAQTMSRLAPITSEDLVPPVD